MLLFVVVLRRFYTALGLFVTKYASAVLSRLAYVPGLCLGVGLVAKFDRPTNRPTNRPAFVLGAECCLCCLLCLAGPFGPNPTNRYALILPLTALAFALPFMGVYQVGRSVRRLVGRSVGLLVSLPLTMESMRQHTRLRPQQRHALRTSKHASKHAWWMFCVVCAVAQGYCFPFTATIRSCRKPSPSTPWWGWG